MKNTRWWTSLALATATALVLAACSADTGEDTSTTPEEQVSKEAESPAPAAVDHNAADTEFAQMMIIHHQGAIEMAEAVRNDSRNPVVIQFAGTVIDDQVREVTEMTNLVNAL